MPTGYTSGVMDGKVTEFRDFAMECARAFGALILMRDEPHDAPIPNEFGANTRYHDEAIEKARRTLVEAESMDLDLCAKEARAEHDNALAARQERIERREAVRARYQAMLDKVEAWEPPSADHVGMKRFMAEQLRESMDFDCNDSYDSYPKFLRGDEWRKARIEQARRDVDYHTKAREEEIQRTESRNRWLQQLRESLEAL